MSAGTEQDKQHKAEELYNSSWRERPGMDNCGEDEYFATVHCTNGCGYSGERIVYVKKGVRRDQITNIKCENCGCEAKL